MDVIARRDVSFSEPNYLTVPSYRIPVPNSSPGNFVAGRDGSLGGQLNRAIDQLSARFQGSLDHSHVIVLPKEQRKVFKFLFGHGSFDLK
jgi:hypothetical protein